jgi:hypothetical protein
MDPTQIPGYGIDADFSRRPGVPMYRSPHPEPFARIPPPRQQSAVKQFMHGRPGKTYPPVWGTAQPPKGLSGLLRGYAYKYPDHYTRHWTMLMLADRVNVWEQRLGRGLPLMALVGAGFVVGRALLGKSK